MERSAAVRGGRRLTALVVGLLVLPVACTGGDDPKVLPDHTLGPETTTTTEPVFEDLDGVPALAEVAHPPGTELDDGLVTPPGAGLLGDLLPVDDAGWRALFLVTGDPKVALDDLSTQYAPIAAAHPAWQLRLYFVRQGPGPLVPEPTSELLVHLRKPSTGGGGEPIRRVVVEGDTEPLPSGFGAPTPPGERFGWDDDEADPVLHALTVPPGAFEALHAFAALTTSRNTGYQSLLRIDGDPSEVADDLAAQVRDLGQEVSVERRIEGPTTVTRLTSDGPAYYFIEVVDGGPGHRWVYVVTDPGD